MKRSSPNPSGKNCTQQLKTISQLTDNSQKKRCPSDLLYSALGVLYEAAKYFMQSIRGKTKHNKKNGIDFVKKK